MWDVSANFLAALRGAHQMVTTVDVLDQGVTVLSGVAVTGGQLVRDRKAQVYGRLTVEIADPTVAPIAASSPLGPAGFELVVNRGVRFADGTIELVPLGVFPIQSATVDGVSMTTSIEAFDRSQRVADARLETDRHFAPGTDTGSIAVTIVQEVISDVELDVATVTTETSGRLTYEAQADRWAIVQDIYKAASGAEVFFDGQGVLVARPEPDVTTAAPVWTVDEGATGVLVSVDLAWDRRPSYNRAIVTGTNTEFGITYRGVATDNSSASPSQYSGRFGPKPFFYFSPHVTSNASAAQSARGILTSLQGVAMSLDLSAVPNPALEPGDVVNVVRQQLGLNMAVVIDSVTLDLGPEGAMSCEVRARQEDAIP